MSESGKISTLLKLVFGIGVFFLAIMTPSWAVTPMDYYNSFVAGGDEAGFRDGAFFSARFNEPIGLAFNDAGNKLYVADSGNNCIRVVDLDLNNEVSTLAGTGAVGVVDGPMSKATFNFPTKLAVLPGNRMVVFDSKNNSIRLLNLQNQTVSTIAKGIYVWDMVYRPKDDSLYFSEWTKVGKINMKSLAISEVFSSNALVPAPGALCLLQDDLCVADIHLPTIYQMKFDNNQSAVTVLPSFSAMGNAKNVLSLSVSDGHLYALQNGGDLIRVGLPDSSLVKFPTQYGFLFQNQDHKGIIPLLNIRGDCAVGFSASPSEFRKFFIATKNSIISVKDYDFETEWSGMKDVNEGLADFNYPTKKPARTFRILVMGASRNSTAVPIPLDPNAAIDEGAVDGDPKVSTYGKQLEVLLNTEAVLNSSKIHFEILNVTRRGIALNSYAYFDIPTIVKKYDIDLVLGIMDFTGYIDYYMNAMTSEGIPKKRSYYMDVDYEYIKKPLSERASSGVAADLLKRCKELKIPFSDDYPGDGLWGLVNNQDAQIQNDLTEMAGRRLQLLNDKLSSFKNSEGHFPQMALFYVPNPACPNDCLASFWNGVCSKYGLKYINLSESFNTLKDSYYPTAGPAHFTAHGNELIARLLAHYLMEDKQIPF